jgi:hypothetical protein
MKPSIALEINEHWLKLVAVNPVNRQPSSLRGLVRSIESFNESQITQTLLESLRELKLKPAPVIISLPRNQVTLRNLHLPSQNTQEINQMVQLNIARIVPYKTEEVVYSYRILGKDDIGYTKIVLAIVHRDAIKKLLNIMDLAGLFIDNIVLSSYGPFQWVSHKYKAEIRPPDLNFIIDLDFNFSDFIVFSGQELLYSHCIAIDSRQLADEIGIKKLIGEIRQSLVIFHNEEVVKKPYLGFICGAAGNAGTIMRSIEKELEVSVRDACMPLQLGVQMPKTVSVTSLSQFVLGENDKNLSFILPEIQIRKAFKEKTREIMILGSLAIYFFMALCGIFCGKLYNQQSYLKMLKEKNKVVLQGMEGAADQSRRIDFIKDFLAKRRLPVFLLSQLYDITPDEIAIKYLNVNKDKKVNLRGEASQLSEVFKFVGILEKTKYFKDVQTRSTRKRKLKDKEMTDFELSFGLEL